MPTPEKSIQRSLKMLGLTMIQVNLKEMGELVNDFIVTKNMPFELKHSDFYPLRPGYVFQASIRPNFNCAMGIAFHKDYGAVITLNEIERAQYDILYHNIKFDGGLFVYSTYDPDFTPLLPTQAYDFLQVNEGAHILIDTRPNSSKIWISDYSGM